MLQTCDLRAGTVKLNPLRDTVVLLNCFQRSAPTTTVVWVVKGRGRVDGPQQEKKNQAAEFRIR